MHVLALVLVLLTGAQAVASEISFCTVWKLSLRKGRKTCWAEYNLRPEQKICFSKSFWEHWVRNPYPLCGRWTGRWKVYANLANEQQKEKKRFWVFRVNQMDMHEKVSGPDRLGFLILSEIEKIRERLSQKVSLYDQSGLVRKLLLDERKSGSPDAILRTLGFVHLLTPTGIHLYAAAQVLYSVIFKISSWSGIKTEKALCLARVLSVLSWFWVWLLGGARPGMLRPWVIVILRSLGRLVGVRWRLFAPFFLAIALDLLVALVFYVKNGESWAPGRIHYALAVGGGLLAFFACEGKSEFKKHMALSVGSWFPTAIWDIFVLNLVATATPLLSLLTIPFFSLFVFPLLLLSSFFLILGLDVSTDFILQTVSFLAERFIENLFLVVLAWGSLWQVGTWASLVGIFSGFLFLQVRTLKNRLCFFVGIALMRVVFSIPLNKEADVTRLAQLDVGQGDSAWVEGAGGRLGLVDVGSRWALSPDSWLKILAKNGRTEVDWIFLTHLDEDHWGGLLNLSMVSRLKCLGASKGELESARGRRISLELRRIGVFLQPYSERCIPYPYLTQHSKRKGRNQNMGAILLPLSNEGYFLSAGDADKKFELEVAKWAIQKGFLKRSYRVVKISHHGSKYSTSSAFLDLLHPTEVWNSAGLGNRFGHPSLEVLKRLRDHGTRVRRTDQKGIIVFKAGVAPHRRLGPRP